MPIVAKLDRFVGYSGIDGRTIIAPITAFLFLANVHDMRNETDQDTASTKKRLPRILRSRAIGSASPAKNSARARILGREKDLRSIRHCSRDLIDLL
jgi:hypothetical protein